jgi:hypothetical protein
MTTMVGRTMMATARRRTKTVMVTMVMMMAGARTSGYPARSRI